MALGVQLGPREVLVVADVGVGRGHEVVAGARGELAHVAHVDARRGAAALRRAPEVVCVDALGPAGGVGVDAERVAPRS